MRKLRRSRNKKHVRVVLAVGICLLTVMTVGYAAFSTNVSLNAKGNLVRVVNAEFGGISVKTVKSGDGLYDNGDGTFTYKGANPDNYISINDETWRIIGIDSQGIKIIKDEKIDLTGYSGVYAGNSTEGAFDKENVRTIENNSYCTSPQYGCNAWAATANLVTQPAEFVNGTASGAVAQDATVNTWLNETYYTNTLGSNSNIVRGTYNVGNSNDESAYQWQGYVALLTVSEYIAAGGSSSYLKKSYYWWLLSPCANDARLTYYVDQLGNTMLNQASYNNGVRPVLYLDKNSIELSGKGKSDDMYTFQGSSPAPALVIDDTFEPQYYEYHTGSNVTIGSTATTSTWTQDPSSLERDYYLGHDVDGSGNVTANYACFILNNTQYCMRGRDGFSGTNYFTQNKALLGTLKDANAITCTEFSDSNAECSGGSLGLLHAYSSGYAGAGVSSSVHCYADIRGRSSCIE